MYIFDWVFLFGPLVGWAVSRGESRGLGSLFSRQPMCDGWGCVPAQFVVWPKVHRLLDRSDGLGANEMCISKSVHQAGCSPACPSTVSVPPVWATATLPLQEAVQAPAGWSGPGSHQIAAFPLGPCVLKTLYVPFRSKVSISPSPTGLLTAIPCLFSKARRSGSSSSQCRTQAEESDMGLRIVLCENFYSLIISQFVGHPPGGYGIWLYCESAPPAPLVVSFLMFLVLVASVFFISDCSADVILVCS